MMTTRRTLVLYHGNCYDGFAAAWAAWKLFGDEADYLPAHYGGDPPQVERGQTVFVLDFSYPRSVLESMHTCTGGRVRVLDHHKTAEEALRDLKFATFDMTKSGARLAWEHFHPGEAIPELISYCEDRDLWRFVLPESREVHVALKSYPFNFSVWDGLDLAALRHDGSAILRYQKQMVNLRCEHAWWVSLGGFNVPIVNATENFSEVPEELCRLHPEAPFAAYYLDMADGVRQFGLRSRGDFDVSAVAKQYGGGGHRNAAGFRMQHGEMP